MLFKFAYEVGLIFLTIIAAPKLLYQWIFHKKYRLSISQRFGIGFPKIDKGPRTLIWVHAVSLGETKAVSSIVKRIKKEHPEALIVTSSVTETGFAEAEKSMPEADHHVFLPLDFIWNVKPLIKQVKPDVVILCETDFWYNFLRCCKNEGSSILLVNGKISNRSLQRYKKFPWYSRRIFGLIDQFCVQSDHYKDRFLELGIDSCKIHITGNIKFDANYPTLSSADLLAWKEKLGIDPNNMVLVAGSTHHPEEKLILDSMQKIWENIPEITLLIVPRHEERFEVVAGLLNQSSISYQRYSQGADKRNRGKVILVDAIGVLRQCYQLADVAFVGGSFTTAVGGHNIIEPSGYGVPMLYGPHMHQQPELVELVQKYGAGLQVDSSQLAEKLQFLFQNTAARQKIGRNGLEMVQELKGGTEKTYKTIFLDKNACNK